MRYTSSFTHAFVAAVTLASLACRDAPTATESVPLSARQYFAVAQSGLPFSDDLAELGDEIFDDRNLSIRKNQACNA